MNDGRMRMELVEWNGGLRTAEMRGSDGKRERGGVGWGGEWGGRERGGGGERIGKGGVKRQCGSKTKREGKGNEEIT